MQVTVRVNGALLAALGRPRLFLELPPEATVADMQRQLQQNFPDQVDYFKSAVAVAAGQHLPPESRLPAGQEIALLLPVAGG
ncbi:MAG: MoaD/ThiS family protein [Anaerolineales bacterium]|nr:MoaD/ThiS family protein [Anaerolineales bacterium]MCB0015091.1 MoaD/ThiS family protein [Anaerolineales bacterium]